MNEYLDLNACTWTFWKTPKGPPVTTYIFFIVETKKLIPSMDMKLIIRIPNRYDIIF
jgi:hypothetical protein